MPGTVGWSTTFGGTLTWNPQVQRGDPTFGVQNNQFGFTIASNSNLVVVVEAYTSLANPFGLRCRPTHSIPLSAPTAHLTSVIRYGRSISSIGLLLCKERDHLTVEYALRDLKKPIGVAQWQTKLVESLPRNLKGSLPTVAEIEAELDNARTK
jgi:hypothetical protein